MYKSALLPRTPSDQMGEGISALPEMPSRRPPRGLARRCHNLVFLGTCEFGGQEVMAR